MPSFLLPRYFKWIGLTIYLLTFVYAASYSQHDLNDVSHIEGFFVQFFILLGLVMMLGARLKVEDEFTKHIRLVSLQWSLVLYISYRVLCKAMAFFMQDITWLPKGQTNFLLLLYLILFYTQVYFIPYIKNRFLSNEE